MSLRKAIDEKCKECIYDALCSGSWRKQTEACEMKDCALWDVRPTTGATREAKRKEKGKIDLKEIA